MKSSIQIAPQDCETAVRNALDVGYRMIDTAAAYMELKNNQVSAQQSDVVAITCDSSAADFAAKISCFAREGLSVEYMYCFSVGDKAFLILRTSDNARVPELVSRYGLQTITEHDLSLL